MSRRLSLRRLAALMVLLTGFGLVHARANEVGEGAALVPVKMGIKSLDKKQQVDLWRRVGEYAAVDALMDFCGKKLNLERRTWAAVAPCVEVPSLRRVAGVFRAKKAAFIKGWETIYGDPEKKKAACDGFKSKFPEYIRILDAHIVEARSMCSACLWC